MDSENSITVEARQATGPAEKVESEGPSYETSQLDRKSDIRDDVALTKGNVSKHRNWIELALSPITNRLSAENKQEFLYQWYAAETFIWCLVCNLLPLLIFTFLPIDDPQWLCLYLILVVVIGWIVNYTDIVMVAFYPLILAPLMALASVASLATAYFGTTVILYVSAAIVGGGFQSVGLDRRFALFMMTNSSLQLYDVMWRFLLISSIVSMWISNTASATLVIPILKKLLILIEAYFIRLDAAGLKDPRVFKPPPSRLNYDQFRAAAFVVMAYGANFGGMFTKVGSIPNLAYSDIFEGEFGFNTELTFPSFSAFAFPLGILTLIATYVCVLYCWEGIKNSNQTFGYLFKSLYYSIKRIDPNKDIEGAKEYADAEKAALETMGPWTYAEIWMGVLCLLTVILLFFRDPGFGFPGWSSIFPGNHQANIHDSSATLIVAFLCFLVPKYSHKEIKKAMEENPDQADEVFLKMSRARLLTWKQCEHCVDWGVMWMLGSGSALAAIMRTSGLSNTIGDSLNGIFVNMSEPTVIFVIVIVTSLTSELATNTVMAQIFTPVLIAVSLSTGVCYNPLYLSFVGLMGLTYAMMLPIATPSNILVFKAADLKLMDFARSGWLLKIVGVPLVMFATFTYGYDLLSFGTFPEWAVGHQNSTCVAT